MIRHLLCLCFAVSFITNAIGQALYSNANLVSRFNPGIGVEGTPRIVFDDVNIPASLVSNRDSISITKVKVGIRRLANAPATNVSIYYTVFDDTATRFNHYVNIPPVLLGTVSLPANGPSNVLSIVAFGDSVTALFKLKTDIGAVKADFHTFYIGASLSNASNNNGIGLASGSGTNDDVVWVYDVDDPDVRYATNFRGTPVATFHLEVFGPTGTTLPVSLVKFSGEKKDKGNVLSWTTRSEVNNRGFELLKSFDGRTFSSIGFVDSKAVDGNSSAVIEYNFNDIRAITGNSYYQLKQVDKDGKSSLSNIVLIKGERLRSLALSRLYPNPTRSEVKVIINAPTDNKVQLLLTDITGKVVLQQSVTVKPGDNNFTIGVNALSTGSYIIKAVCSEGCETTTSTFIKQ